MKAISALHLTLKSLYMTICDEPEEIAEVMSNQDMLTEIYEAHELLKREVKALEDDIDDLGSDKDDLEDKVDKLLTQLNTGLYEPVDLEFELYKLNIPNPFSPSQMIQINNHLYDLANVEIVIL